jgi:hypothetical protein
MYNKPGSALCPVLSYKIYMAKLHPDLDALWQRPLESFEPDDSVWYYRQRVGVNTLAKFMGVMSTMASLSIQYTNHSIRATSITMMDEAGIEAHHES